ncbi:MAG: hypothetical protein M1608_02075 [Candidatus Omnitrophica bacterium]|nr:hypothetical protein [Candidatus Omnitrophota bacterium]
METFFNNLSAEEGTKKKLLRDLTTLLGDTEELVKLASENWTKKTKEDLIEAMEKIKTGCEEIRAKAVVCANATDQNIRRYPYPWVGFAFGVGLLAGLLVNRNS